MYTDPQHIIKPHWQNQCGISPTGTAEVRWMWVKSSVPLTFGNTLIFKLYKIHILQSQDLFHNLRLHVQSSEWTEYEKYRGVFII